MKGRYEHGHVIDHQPNGLTYVVLIMYAAALKRFHTFCTTFNISTPFPVTEQLLCGFSAHLADQGLAPQTGSAYLAAVRNMQFSLSLSDPRDTSSLPILRWVQAGIKRSRLQRQAQTRVRFPITAPILDRIRATLDSSAHPHKVLLWAVACTAFFGFFRLGELLPESTASISPATTLMWGDVAIDNPAEPTMVKIHLKRAKCDQFGKGEDIIVGLTHNRLCPVAALSSFMVARGTLPGPFFTDKDGTPLIKAWFVREIREVLKTIGLPQGQYAGP